MGPGIRALGPTWPSQKQGVGVTALHGDTGGPQPPRAALVGQAAGDVGGVTPNKGVFSEV